jgi:hypothetical protein
MRGWQRRHNVLRAIDFDLGEHDCGRATTRTVTPIAMRHMTWPPRVDYWQVLVVTKTSAPPIAPARFEKM